MRLLGALATNEIDPEQILISPGAPAQLSKNEKTRHKPGLLDPWHNAPRVVRIRLHRVGMRLVMMNHVMMMHHVMIMMMVMVNWLLVGIRRGLGGADGRHQAKRGERRCDNEVPHGCFLFVMRRRRVE